MRALIAVALAGGITFAAGTSAAQQVGSTFATTQSRFVLSAERLLGYTAAEAIGHPITIIIPPDRQDEEREILSRIRAGERVEHFETVRLRKGNVQSLDSVPIDGTAVLFQNPRLEIFERWLRVQQVVN